MKLIQSPSRRSEFTGCDYEWRCHACATTATTHSTLDAVSLPKGWTLSNTNITTTVCRSCNRLTPQSRGALVRE